MYPTTNLTYGQSGPEVTKLQNFLISQGIQIPAGATGYFGDQTKAALLQWQQKTGVGGPVADLGSNWGPLSIAAANKVNSSSVSTLAPEQKVQYDQLIASGAPASQALTAAQQVPVAAVTSTDTTSSISSSQPQLGMIRPAGGGMESPNPNFNTVYGGVTEQQAIALKNAGISANQWNTDKTQGGSLGTTWLKNAMNNAPATVTNPNLTADQNAIINEIVNTNDPEKLKAAILAASKFSDPYFKAQTALAVDALDRSLNQNAGDLAYEEQSLRAKLDKLKADTAASKDQLTFQQQQDLKNLQTKYETDLATTQDSLAASGFTNSSKRARAEDILASNNQGLVESTNKQFGYQTGNLDRTLTASDAATQAQLANLQRLADAGSITDIRKTEGLVGSDALAGYSNLLGGQTGSLVNQKNTQDIASGIDIYKSGASNFVF